MKKFNQTHLKLDSLQSAQNQMQFPQRKKSEHILQIFFVKNKTEHAHSLQTNE